MHWLKFAWGNIIGIGKYVLHVLIMQQVVTRTRCPLEAQGTCLIYLCYNTYGNFSVTVEVLVAHKLQILVQGMAWRCDVFGMGIKLGMGD
jgi:hypothetical protein